MLCLLPFYPVSAQFRDGAYEFTLKQVISLAQTQSPDYQRAKNQLNNSYWQYRNHLSRYKPQLTLNIDAPDISRTIIPVTQNSGLEAFRERSLANSSVDLSLTQNIAPTGGTFFATSQLNRLDILGNESSTSYLSYPVVVGIRQPVFGFNPLRWDARIEPKKYEEAKRIFTEDLEAISVKSTNLFFNLLLSQINLEISEKNAINNDTIYKLAIKKYEIGKIAESELLQVELNYLNAQQARERAKLDNEIYTLQLKSFLSLEDTLNIMLIPPDEIPQIYIDEQKALAEARKNRAKVITIQRRLLEAEKEIAFAKGNSGFNMDINFSFGYTQSASTFTEVYRTLQDQQRFQLSFEIPILDWGRSKSAIKTALSNQELVEAEAELAEREFEQEIYLQVKQWNIYRQQLQSAVKADEIAQKRFEIAKERYLSGKIGITELNIAQNDREEAKYNYLSNLKNIWSAYYTIRLLTLFDFENSTVIEPDNGLKK
ncbi:MAG: TolC family protein [Thermonemataceae bacterium]